ncbi:MAG: TatD family hydrolase [Patescibacteria group bacterium]
MRFIDTHSHIHHERYYSDRDAMLARMRERGVATITVGTTYALSKSAVDLAGAHPDVWATIGQHPVDTLDGFDSDAYASLLTPRVVAVGECGLDYFRGADEAEKNRQKKVFETQIAFAVEHNLPLMLHVRPGKGSADAHDDALGMLKSAQTRHGACVRGNSHFFTAPLAIARQYWAIGFTTAFPGVITFATETQEVVREAPLDMILSETDAPYATPIPHRGERNEPAFVTHIVDSITAIRSADPEQIAEQLLVNARRVFGLVPHS